MATQSRKRIIMMSDSDSDDSSNVIIKNADKVKVVAVPQLNGNQFTATEIQDKASHVEETKSPNETHHTKDLIQTREKMVRFAMQYFETAPSFVSIIKYIFLYICTGWLD